VLLPPIIFESGYNMHRRKFFQNLGAICLFAFLGTTISAAVVGWILWASGVAAVGGGGGLSAVEALSFGALISATDPVTVLAVFGSAGADRDLHALVFGESVLNDAVAIVLYRALEPFAPGRCDGGCAATAGAVAAAVGSAAWIFGGSVAVGGGLAAASSLLHKHLRLGAHARAEHFETETLLLLVVPYAAWIAVGG
jgi:NhaP-type Na+/H+ or K+/H+ antiporter